MTGWRLDPAGIAGVLSAVSAEAEGLGEFLGGTEQVPVGRAGAVMAGLGSRAEVLWPVAAAVDAALVRQAGSLTSISNRIEAGLVGVANATVAYNRGQADMAAQCQSAAAAAAGSGDFSWFDEHGVW